MQRIKLAGTGKLSAGIGGDGIEGRAGDGARKEFLTNVPPFGTLRHGFGTNVHGYREVPIFREEKASRSSIILLTLHKKTARKARLRTGTRPRHPMRGWPRERQQTSQARGRTRLETARHRQREEGATATDSQTRNAACRPDTIHSVFHLLLPWGSRAQAPRLSPPCHACYKPQVGHFINFS